MRLHALSKFVIAIIATGFRLGEQNLRFGCCLVDDFYI
jgi:hypothetical protein